MALKQENVSRFSDWAFGAGIWGTSQDSKTGAQLMFVLLYQNHLSLAHKISVLELKEDFCHPDRLLDPYTQPTRIHTQAPA